MIRSHRGVAIPTFPAPRLMFRALAGFALLLVASLPVLSQDEPPRFLLEKILVEGLRRAGADRLVVAESLLREGAAYSEDDLRQAVYRIKRLPFILDAEFTLRRGSERGRYELLIGVEEVKPYFLQWTGDYDLEGRPFRGTSLRERLLDSGLIGVRYFANSHDLAFATWNPDGFVNLGYTRFNLFGRGGYASLQTSFHAGGDDRSVSLTMAVPLTGNHALRSTTDWRDSDFSDGWNQGLEWIYNTTDDPLLPTEGVEASLSALVGVGRVKRVPTFDGKNVAVRQHAATLAASSHKHWAWTSRQSVSLGGEAFYSRQRADRESFGVPSGVYRKNYGAGIDLGYALSVWRTQGLGPHRDLSLEAGASFSDQRSDPAFFFNRARSWGANLGLVFRNAWSLIRLTFRYNRLLGDGR